uniref:Uncharacterized protein n=1 Tax=Candidatus Kentrum sp. TC TaxID=2126339 RepID=A0A451A0K4_9GAMM|nr:MAG: hypothetical protein BECKTC1821F_GA0114240_10351 [Candidatus Kentron sp. TC]
MSKKFSNREISICNHNDTSDFQESNFFGSGYAGLGDVHRDRRSCRESRYFHAPAPWLKYSPVFLPWECAVSRSTAQEAGVAAQQITKSLFDHDLLGFPHAPGCVDDIGKIATGQFAVPDLAEPEGAYLGAFALEVEAKAPCR